MRFEGSIVEWNEARGFGFIEPAAGSGDDRKRVFCHIKAYRTLTAVPTVGQRVTYEMSCDQQNRPRATRVVPAGTSTSVKVSASRRDKAFASRSRPGLAKVGASVFIAVLIALVVVDRIRWYVPVWYVLISFVTAIAYAIDKGSAERRRWRTTESTLQWMALIGGWPGAWIAQQDLRHKTRKASFQSLFWGLVVINIAVLAWLAVTRILPPLLPAT